MKIIISILAGLLLGFLCASYIFVSSWLSLILWGVVGLVLGYWSWKNRPLLNGAVYGFVLSFTFLVAGYSGAASLLSRVPFFTLLSLFGTFCGLVLGLIGSRARNLVEKRAKQPV